MIKNPVHCQEYCSSSPGFFAAQVQYLVNLTFKTLRKMTIWFCKCQHFLTIITIYFAIHFPKTLKIIWFCYVFCMKEDFLLTVSRKWMLSLDFWPPGLGFRPRARFPASRARIALRGRPDDARCCQKSNHNTNTNSKTKRCPYRFRVPPKGNY